MKIIKVREEDSKTGEPINLFPIGDTHLGAIDVDEDALRADIERIKNDPFARVIFMGDSGDCITHRDPRFAAGMWAQRYINAMHQEGGVITETVEHVAELFDPIRDKVWGWLSGNHERTVRKHTDREIGNEICALLGIANKYMGYGGFIRIDWHRPSSKAAGSEYSSIIDVSHGWQAGRRSGAKINQLEVELSYTDADVVLRGHSHDRVAQIFQSLKVERSGLREWPRVVAHTGTYKQGWVEPYGETHDTWEETRGFRRRGSSTTGPPIIRILPRIQKQSPGRASGGTMKANINYEVIL